MHELFGQRTFVSFIMYNPNHRFVYFYGYIFFMRNLSYFSGPPHLLENVHYFLFSQILHQIVLWVNHYVG